MEGVEIQKRGWVEKGIAGKSKDEGREMMTNTS